MRRWAILLLTVTTAGLLAVASPAHATTYTVNSTDDAGDQSRGNGICDTEPFPVGTEPKCTLRAAIQDANYTAGADTIVLPAGTYTLTVDSNDGTLEFTGDLDIKDNLTITGAGARTTGVVGGPEMTNERIFENWSGVTTTIRSLTVTGGDTFVGGGISSQGNLTLDGVAVKANTASTAGGVESFGTLNITDSTISGNEAGGNFGGVYQEGGTANITNSTISGNHSADYGGGITAQGGAIMNILNSTITSNTSGRLGGGILTEGASTLVTAKNTIVAANTLDNCDSAQLSGGIISSQGNNLEFPDDSCGFEVKADPKLGPLQNNGGPADTRALLAGSPALDAGINTDCPATDQRGEARPTDGDGNGAPTCDIGAFEKEAAPPPPNTAPTITPLSPLRKTRSTRPLISAKVSDAQTELARSNITLLMDNRPRAFAYSQGADTLTSRGTKLKAGKRHTVRIAADDGALSTTRSWSFKVIRRR